MAYHWHAPEGVWVVRAAAVYCIIMNSREEMIMSTTPDRAAPERFPNHQSLIDTQRHFSKGKMNGIWKMMESWCMWVNLVLMRSRIID